MKVAAITMVYRDYWALSQWYRHFGAMVGYHHLYIVAHGHDPEIARLCPDASIITVPRDDMAHFDRRRARMLNAFQAALIETYDWIIRTDADELICFDPRLYTGVEDFLVGQSGPALFALGLNVVDTNTGSYAVFSGHYSKAWAVNDTTQLVQHGVRIRPNKVERFRFQMPRGVYLVHLKFANHIALAASNAHRLDVASLDAPGLPGKAWKRADEAAEETVAKVDIMDEVSWEVARDAAYGKLHRTAAREEKTGVIHARFLRFQQKCQFPDWIFRSDQ